MSRPYKWIARYYDQLHAQTWRMNHAARQKILGDILTRAQTVCDLGCGTGTTAVRLARKGKKIYAVDLSPDMCRLARAKARKSGLPIRVMRADMRSFRLPERVDLVLCEFNPINHLPRHSDLAPTARNVARVLRPGGYFYFDLNGPMSFKKLYSSVFWTEKKDFCMIFRGGRDVSRRKGWMDVEWFIRQGQLWRREHERIEDTYWNDGEIRRALRAAGFRNIRRWDGADVRPKQYTMGRNYDLYYLAQKI